MVGGPLPQHEFEAIFAKVPRLTVEIVLLRDGEVFLTRRSTGPCAGLWHLPGGTVRFGEPLIEAIARVGRNELGIEVAAGDLLGIIEYPSHLAAGIDWPVGVAFSCSTPQREPTVGDAAQWFCALPDELHEEQRTFLGDHVVGGNV